MFNVYESEKTKLHFLYQKYFKNFIVIKRNMFMLAVGLSQFLSFTILVSLLNPDAKPQTLARVSQSIDFVVFILLLLLSLLLSLLLLLLIL